MGKAILIIDTPENCEDCPLFRTDKDFNATIHYCMPYPGKELFMVNEKGVSDNCPLKSMPQKRVLEDFVQKDYFMDSKVDVEKMIRYIRARANNEIIDEILGVNDE